MSALADNVTQDATKMGEKSARLFPFFVASGWKDGHADATKIQRKTLVNQKNRNVYNGN